MKQTNKQTILAGGVCLPKSTGGMLVVAFFWIITVVVLVTFSANLVAFLSVTRGEIPFQTLEEVAIDKAYALNVPNGTITVTLLQVLCDSMKREYYSAH